MVIRRIREHVGTHNWFAVGIDLAEVRLEVLARLGVHHVIDEDRDDLDFEGEPPDPSPA